MSSWTHLPGLPRAAASLTAMSAPSACCARAAWGFGRCLSAPELGSSRSATAHPAVTAIDALLVDVGERCDLGLVTRWRARHADLPILALGPFGEPELRLAAHDAGADACVPPDASAAVVRSWLDAVTGRNRLARPTAAAPA